MKDHVESVQNAAKKGKDWYDKYQKAMSIISPLAQLGTDAAMTATSIEGEQALANEKGGNIDNSNSNNITINMGSGAPTPNGTVPGGSGSGYYPGSGFS